MITSAQDLALLAVNCSTNDAAQSFTTGKYFEIVLPEEANNTIDLSEYYWTPIARFYGYLDGNGALISGLKIGNNEENGAYTKAANVGLFGRIDSGSVVEKLSVEVSIYTNFATANHTVGGVAGMSNGATIDSCTVTGQITAANAGNTDSNRLVAAGIVGTAQNNSVITNCVNKATVNSLGNSGLTFAAGIAGYTNGVKIINDCNIGVISAAATGTNGKDAYAGGIVVLTNGTNELHNCYNTGAITATSETGTPYPGSIAGQVVNCTMSNLYWQKDTAAVIFGKGATSDIAAMEADELKATDFLNSLNINAAKLNESAAANNAYKWITDTVTGYAIPGTELATDKTLIVNVNSERMGRVKVEVQTPNSSTYTEVATSTLVENGSTVRLTAIPVNGIKIVSMTVNGTEVTLTEGSYTFTLTASTTVEVIFEVDGQFVADPIYVNSNVTASGNGTSPATAFKTLAEAQTKLRTVLDANPTAEVTIYLMGGTYVLDETWELNEEDTSFGRVTIKNYEDETPVITSGHAIPLGGFSQVTGKNYWAYQIPQNADGSYPAFRDLLVNGERATLAKTKEYTYQKSFKNSTANGKLIAQDASGKYMMENGLYVSEEALSGITNDNFSGLELAQLQEWKSQIFHVGSIAGKDTESGEIEITIKDSEWDNYYTNEVNIFVLTGRNYWLQNHINFLDEPGEFYYDQSNGMVYYYPYADENMSEAVIEYATLDNLIDITNAANITIDGITFTGTTANTITEKGILAQLGLTTSTSQFDAGTSISFAAIKGDVVEGVCIQNCTFKELGGSGMVFYYDVKDMLINGNSFKDIAMAGILVGVNQRTFGNGASENVTISNNYITNIGVDLNGSPAIRSARAKDLKIQYNTIIHVPYSGIMTGYGFSLHATDLSRNTNLVNADISYNYVEDYLYKINDGGGIYTCGANQFTDNAELINKIHHNYVRAGAHNSTYTGIYHDGSASNWHTYENVIDDLKSRKGPMFFQDDVKDQYTHNILSEKNYTTVSKITTTASASRNIVLKDNVMFADRNELFASAEAAAIVNGAGLQNAYKGIATPMDVELRIADNTMHYVVDSSKETNTVAKIELTNNSDETRTFTISLTDALPNYVSCQLENNGVITLDANETAIVKAEFIVTDKNKFEDKEDFVIGFQVEDSVGRKTLYPRVFTVGCSTGEARIAHGTPTMDGVLDDAYMKSTNITVGNIFNMVSFTAHETPQKYPLTDADSDVTGFARLLWDEDYLYCYIYVEEKDSQVTSVGKEFIDYRLNDNASLPEGLWKNDGVELFIKTNGKSSKFAVDAFGIQRYGDNITLDVHNALPYTTAFTYNGEIVEGLKITNPVMGQSASTTEKPVNGYVIEMALPITLCSDLAVEGKPQAGDKIWFQMQNNDLERSEEQQKNYTVSLHTTGKEYLLVKEEVENNVASIDGVSYPTLEEALNNAEAGKTVKLEADATLPSVYDKEVTYDLNGHTLSGDAFTGINATVVDSSNGAGLLKVPQNGLALDSNNDGYMPVWDSTNAGYRFAKVTIEDRNVDNTGDALVFSMRPSFGSDAIGQLVAKGYETGMVRVGVRITWIDPETGITKTQDLALDDSLLSTMYSDPSAPKGVKFTISGGETIKSFTATTIVWSNLEKCKSVEIVGTKHTYQAKAE